MINPNNDGIDHINVYSGSRTSLGRMLSNFYMEDINTKDGQFKSVEAYWFWLGISTDCPFRDEMRELYGIRAKQRGSYLRDSYPGEDIEDFRDRIIRAIWFKVKKHTDLFLDEYENLPLKHYYVYKNNKVHDVYGKYSWMIEAQEKMKKYIYNQRKKENKDEWIKYVMGTFSQSRL